MDRPTTSGVMAKRDGERDMDLDKKIEALRRKNAALMRRYQEVEEDKKMAEEDVATPPARKGKADDLSITISKSTSESRVVVTKPCAPAAPSARGPTGVGPSRPGEGPLPDTGRGRKKQLTVTMDGRKGKRVVSERVEPGGPGDGMRGPDEDRQGLGGDMAAGAKHPPNHSAKKRDAGATQECEPPQADPATDLTVPTSPQEQEEYLCWKRERQRIDRERVARHKNARGQWRRAWDLDKSESMFSDKCLPEKERGPISRGQRNARRGHQPQDSQGPGRDKVKDKGSKRVPVVCSKAKGKDRLTGRARRWDVDGAGEPAQTADTSLEDFLEELDALTASEAKEDRNDVDHEGEDRRDADPTKGGPSTGLEAGDPGDTLSPPVCAPAPGAQRPQVKDAAVRSPRGTEKRVRFSEELIKGAAAAASAPASGDHPVPRPREAGEAEEAGEESSPGKRSQQETDRPQEVAWRPPKSPGDRPHPTPPERVSPPTEHGGQDSDPPSTERSGGARPGSSEGPPEHAKCNVSNRNTEELIDTGLSVLSLESRDTCSTDTTNTDMARENGKIV